MYKIQQSINGNWLDLGGTYTTSKLAWIRSLQFQECGSSHKPKAFRVRKVYQ